MENAINNNGKINSISRETSAESKSKDPRLSFMSDDSIKKKIESPSKVSKLCNKFFNTTTSSSCNFSGETSATFSDLLVGSSDYQEDITPLISTLNIKVSLYIKDVIADNQKKTKNSDEPTIHSILLTVDNSIYGSDVIKNSIEQFNQLLKDEKLSYRLSELSKKYKLKPSKKNGKPNSDYPAVDPESIIKETGIVNFSLLYIEEDLLYVKPSSQCCNKCLIF